MNCIRSDILFENQCNNIIKFLKTYFILETAIVTESEILLKEKVNNNFWFDYGDNFVGNSNGVIICVENINDPSKFRHNDSQCKSYVNVRYKKKGLRFRGDQYRFAIRMMNEYRIINCEEDTKFLYNL